MAQSVGISYPSVERARASHRGYKSSVTRAARLLESVFHTISANSTTQQVVPNEVLSDLDSLAQKCTDAMDVFQDSLAAIEIYDADLAGRDLEFLDGPADIVDKVKVFITEARLATSRQTVNTPNPLEHSGAIKKINNDLKPEKLLPSSSLAEFRSWKENFIVYYSSNQMDLMPISQQHGYLRSCLDLKLQLALSVKISPLSSVEDCLCLLKGIFFSNTPELTRRFNFFACDQHDGEPFSDWYLRLQVLGQDADLESISVDDLFVMRLVTGTSDGKLKEEFLRHEKPTRSSFVLLAQARESAANIEKSMQKPPTNIQIEAVSSYKKFKGSRHPKRRSWKDLEGKCYRCGKTCSDYDSGECPAKSEDCHKCGKTGHFSKVCMGRVKRSSKVSFQSRKTLSQVNASESEPIDNFLVQVQSVTSFKPTPRAQIEVRSNGGTPFRLKVLPDTGATESLISMDLVDKFSVPIDKSQERQIIAANGSRLRCNGAVHLKLKHLRKYSANIIAFVTPDIQDQLILSWHSMIPLGMLAPSFPLLPTDVSTTQANAVLSLEKSEIHPKESLVIDVDNEIKRLTSRYSCVFDGSSKLKPMKGKPMKIHLHSETEIIPTFTTAVRNVALANRPKFEAEVEFMLKSNIIEPADEPSDWVSPSIIVPKPNGSVRLVVDYTGLNKYVKRPIHPFPSPQELASSIPPSSKWFATFDAVKGYWQVELHKDSRHLTTFLTPLGRFRFCRAPMGLNASGDEYCARGDRALAGIVGVRKIVDDILIYAQTFEELKHRMETVLLRCQDAGITLSKEKVQIGNSVNFAGFIISDKGIAPDPEKVKSISRFPVPCNLTDLRSFLGLANQLGQFVPDLAHASQPLRDLMKKDISFQWLQPQQEAFEKVKEVLTNPDGPILSHFDPCLPTVLLTDASRLKGLGFALLQTNRDGSTRLIQCGSRSLASAESRYAVCELEALAIQWAVLRCRIYLLGIQFTIITDHKPLIGIFKRSNLDAVDNPRLQRILQKLAPYTFQIQWTPGKRHEIADALSRFPVFDPDNPKVEEPITLALHRVTDDLALNSITKVAESDSEYQALITAVLDGKSAKSLPVSHPAKLFSKQWDNLSFDETSGLLVLHNNRIVVPKAKRREILYELHRPHQGLRRSKTKAQNLYFWPGINNDIEQTVNSCRTCQESRPSQGPEPLQSFEAIWAFQCVSVDLFNLRGKDYLE